MNSNNQRLSCQEINRWDMVTYLSGLGYEPSKIRNADHWYLSPFRNEQTPSFKVNQRLNVWYDHGLGKGGRLVDFGILFYHCTVSDLLLKLSEGFSFHQPITHQPFAVKKESKVIIHNDFEIASPLLFQYLEERKIDVDIAATFCREVRYRISNKTYYAIGLKNDSGGYELRNAYFKGSSSPKDITTICNGKNNTQVAVFEGAFDFLSYLTFYRLQNTKESDYVILNSVALFEKARPFIEQHDTALLYLDNDEAGQNCSAYAQSLSDKYIDESKLYQGYKDLNLWLVRKE